MKYKVTHSTSYSYSEAVPVCHNQVHLTPRNGPRQSCLYHRLVVRPAPASSGKRNDYFGNPVHFFEISEGHRKLKVTAISKVDIQSFDPPAALDAPPWEQVREELPRDLSTAGLSAYQFAFDSPHVAPFAELADYARESFPAGRSILEGSRDLTERIHADFTYDAQATTVQTPLPEAFRERRGVCQDLAHIQIGCLRSLGLAARYVSGYLRTYPAEGKPRLVGADASHAWLAVYCGPLGWIDLDPTNNQIPSTEHITVAWGRDYSDVCPIHGMFIGGGQHTFAVSVDVAPLETAG